jgi:CBS domain containing-hemolysin-like protein
VGAQAAKVLSDATILGINVAAVVVPTVMTLAILILSEIIPKTLGASYWRRLTPFTVASLNVIGLVLYPLVWISQRITGILKKGGHASVLSRSEFSAMADVVAEQGALEQQESQFIKNLLRFNRICAQDVMTPRTVVVAAEQNQTVGGHYEEAPNLRLSRIPVYQGDIDHVTGFVARLDVLDAMVQGRNSAALKEIRRQILVVRSQDPLPEVFAALLEERTHMAVVVDAYGGTAGILTMEDVVETLLGLEIVDEFDQAEDMQQLARKKWQQRAAKLGLIPGDAAAGTDPPPDSTPTKAPDA